MVRQTKLGLAFVLSLSTLGLFVAACGSEEPDSTFHDSANGGAGGGASSNFGAGTNEDGAPCEGLACQQVSCAGGGSTTVTGNVFAPNGTLPLYNVVVYVPNAPLEPIATGASCDHCGSVSGKPLVSALTDVNGKFELQNVPVGKDIPLVVQVGKWRRKITIPNVDKCVENKVAATETRLPKNKAEGDIPQIAVTTGRCDQLACLLPKLGLDASEFTASSGPGRLHVYRGAAHPQSAPIAAPAPTGSLDATGWTYEVVIMTPNSRCLMRLISRDTSRTPTELPGA